MLLVPFEEVGLPPEEPFGLKFQGLRFYSLLSRLRNGNDWVKNPPDAKGRRRGDTGQSLSWWMVVGGNKSTAAMAKCHLSHELFDGALLRGCVALRTASRLAAEGSQRAPSSWMRWEL